MKFPNLEQIKSAVAVFLGSAVPIITFMVTYGVPQNIAAIITVVLGVLIVVAWMFYENTQAKTVARAEKITAGQSANDDAPKPEKPS